MTVKQIVLLRHGQTDWNLQYRFQGHSDVPLNAEGERQAMTCLRRMQAWDPQEIWVSSLGRALRTASLATGRAPSEFHVTDKLKEISFGRWEGLTVEQLKAQYEDQYRLWMEDPCLATPTGAETFQQAMKRSGEVLEEALRSSAQRCLLVAHGGIFRALLAQALAIPTAAAWRLKLTNCCFCGLESWNGKLWLAFLNDSAHLWQPQDTEPLPMGF